MLEQQYTKRQHDIGAVKEICAQLTTSAAHPTAPVLAALGVDQAVDLHRTLRALVSQAGLVHRDLTKAHARMYQMLAARRRTSAQRRPGARPGDPRRSGDRWPASAVGDLTCAAADVLGALGGAVRAWEPAAQAIPNLGAASILERAVVSGEPRLTQARSRTRAMVEDIEAVCVRLDRMHTPPSQAPPLRDPGVAHQVSCESPPATLGGRTHAQPAVAIENPMGPIVDR